MTAFERMERMFCGNVERIASTIEDFEGPAFAGYSSESRTIRFGKESDNCYGYYHPMVSVIRMTEGKDGRIDVLFERYRKVRGCDDGTPMHMRLGGEKHWYKGETACRRALKAAAKYLDTPPRLLVGILEEVEEAEGK